MKPLFLILMICLTATVSFGQKPLNAYSGTGYVAKSTPDTTVNTDTTYLANTSGYTTDYNVGWEATITNVSGTTGGTVTAQGSDDNINWYPVVSSALEMTTQTTTITVSGLTGGATKTFTYKWPSHQFTYYRLQFITSGTQTSVMTGAAWLRKKVVIVQPAQ